MSILVYTHLTLKPYDYNPPNHIEDICVNQIFSVNHVGSMSLPFWDIGVVYFDLFTSSKCSPLENVSILQGSSHSRDSRFLPLTFAPTHTHKSIQM